MYQKSEFKQPEGTNYGKLAEDLKNLLFEKKACNLDTFHELVQDSLYDGVELDFASIRQNPTLAAIGALVAHSRRGNVSEVFTFNYDDVLERYLGYQGIIARPIIDERFWLIPADVLVHHPHGCGHSFGSKQQSHLQRTMAWKYGRR